MSLEKTAAFIVIGNEILSGRTKDQNINYLTTSLTEVGINVKEVIIIEDDQQQIIYHINRLKVMYDYLFTSGGIGPTHDDITAEAIAKALNKNLILDREAVKILKEHYKGQELNDARLKMARIPEGSTLLNNPVSSAPGFKIENIFVFAGVPVIMQAMLRASMEHLQPGAKKYSRTVNIFLTESILADEISKIQDKYNEVEIGSYPYIKNNKLGTAIVFRCVNRELIDLALNDYVKFLESNYKNIAELELNLT
ncbi:MAG: competence/damage-inducible protein A [Rickettsiales bacterium]|jgi:molybdenum cofactor synthesis domain-containing protein|nr:competence/damage-inducible protein A [Rickettsiales bacterium]